MFLLCLMVILQLTLVVQSGPSVIHTTNKRQVPSNPCHSTPDSSFQPWPSGVIPYLISTAIPDSLRRPLHLALQKVENMSCVQFLPRHTQSDYVLIEYGERCCSHNGIVGRGPQLLYVSEVCINGNETLSETISKLAHVVIPHKYCQNNCGSSHIVLPGSSPGQISSPGNSMYPPNSNCVWRIWTPHDNILSLHFESIKLEDGRDCLYDYLHIFQEDETGRVINTIRLCGSHSNYRMNTSNGTNVVSVHFHSDSSNEKEGFVLKYSLVNDQVLCAVNNGGCLQICNADAQGVKTHCSCKTGYRLLADNATCTDINECENSSSCQQKCINTVGSYYCHCRQGYRLANDSKTCQVCGGHLNSSHGIITPPRGEGNLVFPYQNCKWTLSIWPGHYLNITIQDIDIYNSTGCSDDFLRPNHGRFRHKKRLCGRHRLLQYILHGYFSQTYFRFYTGIPQPAGEYTGFKISFQQVPVNQVSRSQLKTVQVGENQIAYKTKYWV